MEENNKKIKIKPAVPECEPLNIDDVPATPEELAAYLQKEVSSKDKIIKNLQKKLKVKNKKLDYYDHKTTELTSIISLYEELLNHNENVKNIVSNIYEYREQSTLVHTELEELEKEEEGDY